MNNQEWFAQTNYDVRVEWGHDGTRRAARRGDVVVIVDVLSFGTAVAVAAAKGAIVYPFSMQSQAGIFAKENNAELAHPRRDVPEKGRFSLSPGTMRQATPGMEIALASPNGATCVEIAKASGAAAIFVGALVNARATGNAGSQLAEGSKCGLTIVACGERWDTSENDGRLRFAVEDYLGVCAILNALPGGAKLSPEAQICRALANQLLNLPSLLANCGSGLELAEKGYAEDIAIASGMGTFDVAVILQNGCRLVRFV